MLPFLLVVPAMVTARMLGAFFGLNDFTLSENLREAIGPQCAMMTGIALVYTAVLGLRFRDRAVARNPSPSRKQFLFQDRWQRLGEWYESSSIWIRYVIGPWVFPTVLPLLAICFCPLTSLLCSLILAVAYVAMHSYGYLPATFFSPAPNTIGVTYLMFVALGYWSVVQSAVESWWSDDEAENVA